jgi:hypothetical protein
MRRLVAGLGVLVFAVACGGTSGTDKVATTPLGGQTTSPAPEGDGHLPDGMTGPPPFVLAYDDQELRLEPATWCYETGCVDGIVQHPQSVGSPAAVRIRVPVDGWSLSATFGPQGDGCAPGRRESVSLTPDDEGWVSLKPVGDAGDHVVQLFASGRGGDVATAFAWRTPTDGPHPAPDARAALIAMHDGVPDSYGVEIELRYLAATPKEATATVTITAANGQSKTFEATRNTGSCQAEGSLYFDGPDGAAKAAASLGGAPFDYAITVRLDGAAYKATATYPADVIKGNEPSVPLTFSPPLPAA